MEITIVVDPNPSVMDRPSGGRVHATIRPLEQQFEIHSIHGLPLIIRQFGPPERLTRGANGRTVIKETRLGDETLDIDLQLPYQELYRKLQERATLIARFPREITSAEIVGVIHLDYANRDYPLVEDNWEQLKRFCNEHGANIRFEFHVPSDPVPKSPGIVKRSLMVARRSARGVTNLIVNAFQPKH